MTVYEVFEAAELNQAKQYQAALNLLESVDFILRDAKWCHEYCRANAGLERYYEAAMAAKKAHELEPDNDEYKKEWKAYRKYRRPHKTGERSGCCSKPDCKCFDVFDCYECCFEGCCEGCCECGCEACDGPC